MRTKSRFTKFNGTRAEQLAHLQKTGWQIVRFKAVAAIVAFKRQPYLAAKAWRGEAHKPAWYYTFDSMERMEKAVRLFVENVRQYESRKAAQRAEKKAQRAALKASDYWSVGDVIDNVWGYEQTNVDFYQVVEVKARSIVVREIAQNNSDQGGPSGGRTAPRRNEFTGKPLVKQIDERGHVSFEHGGASKWDGRPVMTTSYH